MVFFYFLFYYYIFFFYYLYFFSLWWWLFSGLLAVVLSFKGVVGCIRVVSSGSGCFVGYLVIDFLGG